MPKVSDLYDPTEMPAGLLQNHGQLEIRRKRYQNKVACTNILPPGKDREPYDLLSNEKTKKKYALKRLQSLSFI